MTQGRRSGSGQLPWWFGVPFLLGGLLVVGLGVVMVLDELRYGSEGVAIQGTVLGTDYSSGGPDSGPSWSVEYEFVDPATGRTYAGETDVSEEVYDSTATGDRIEVTYVPADPAKSRVGPPEPQLVIPLIVVGAGLLFAVVGLGLLALTRWLRSNRPPSWVHIGDDSMSVMPPQLAGTPFAGLFAAAAAAQARAVEQASQEAGHAAGQHAGHAHAGLVGQVHPDDLTAAARVGADGDEPVAPVANTASMDGTTTDDELRALDARLAPPTDRP